MTKRRLVVGIVLVLITTAIGVDRLLTWRTERAIADRVGCAGAAATVKGFPIVHQIIGGRLDDVVVDVPDLRRAHVLFDLRAELRGVHTRGKLRAERADITATVGWSELTRLLSTRRILGDRLADSTLEPADGGIAVRLGQAAGARVLVDVGVDGDEVVLRPESVEVAGREVPPAMVKLFTGRDIQTAQRSFPLDLPDGFVLSAAEADEDGLTVTVVADQISSDGFRKRSRICVESQAGAGR